MSTPSEPRFDGVHHAHASQSSSSRSQARAPFPNLRTASTTAPPSHASSSSSSSSSSRATPTASHFPTPSDLSNPHSGPARTGSLKSRRRRPSLDRVNTDAGFSAFPPITLSVSPTSITTSLPAYADEEDEDIYGHSTARLSPSTPTAPSTSILGPSPSVHRRRQSTSFTPTEGSSSTPRRKRSSRDPTTHAPMRHEQPAPSVPFGWVSTLAPPARSKPSKSDDERDDMSDAQAKWTSSKYWGWNAMPHTSTSRHSSYATLAPLPQDPDHLLPLSAPGTPAGSAGPTPLHSPRGSAADLAGDYLGTRISAGSPPLGSGSSPRTSTSTNSSRMGWSQGRSWSESSRSGAEDDDGSPVQNQREWWWRHDSARPGAFAPRVIRPASTSSRPNLVSTSGWNWLRSVGSLGVLRLRLRADESPSRSFRAMQKRKEKRRTRVRTAPKWLGRIQAFVPTKAVNIATFIVFFGTFAIFMTLMIKHILDPDKQPLPWRSYCLSNHPRLYSLYDPSIPHDPTFSHAPRYTSHPSSRPLPLNSFLPFSPRASLLPVTADHALWPYGTATEAPYETDLTGRQLDNVEPVGVFVGVMTTDKSVERRMMIRQSYASHWRSRRPGTEGVSVRFVMGRPSRRYKREIELEMEAFNDILILDMPENMNAGKTHAFFSWAAENATIPDWSYDMPQSGEGPAPVVWRGERRPDYVVKADDDSFIMLGELERKLRVIPRTKAYWGYLVKNQFMAGECYALSLDLVEYIAASPALRTMTRGKEDKLVAKWMRMHPERERIVWAAEQCWIYDHPKAGTVYSHGFLFPSEVEQIRTENQTGLGHSTLARRGGADAARSYSTVSKFGATYVPPPRVRRGSVSDRVEALVEGSPLSSGSANKLDTLSGVHGGVAARRTERFLGDQRERGGTVVVHYIKKPEWFIETMVALLGSADEQAQGGAGYGARAGSGWGVGSGLGLFESRPRLEVGSGRGQGGV